MSHEQIDGINTQFGQAQVGVTFFTHTSFICAV